MPVCLQAAGQLSEDLVAAICRQSKFTLDRHLSILPPALHVVATHTAFPSLLTHSKLILDATAHSTAATSAVLHQLRPLLAMQHLSISLPYFIPSEAAAATAMASALSTAVAKDGIQQLSISFEKLTDSNAEWLECLLLDVQRSTALTQLCIANACVSNHSLYAPSLQRLAGSVAAVLTHQTDLRSLTLQGVTPHPNESAEHQILVCGALQQLRGLTSLDLDKQFGDPTTLAATLRALPQLLSLRIVVDWMPAPIKTTPGMLLVNGDVLPLCSALGGLGALTALSLAVKVRSSLTQHAPAQLLQALVHLPNMVHLDLSECFVTRVPAFWLAALHKGMPSLRTTALNLLEVNDMTATELDVLCYSAAATLTSLRLFVRRMLMPGAVCRSLPRFPYLQSLCIERAVFNGMNAPELALSLPNLHRLVMNRCIVHRGFERFLACGIQNLTTLTCLELKDITGAPNTALLAGISNLRNLASLALHGFETTEDPAEACGMRLQHPFIDTLDCLRALSSLTCLSLNGCSLGERETRMLAAAFKSLHGL